MKAYLRWSLRQLYLVYFWPSQFKRELNSNQENPPVALHIEVAGDLWEFAGQYVKRLLRRLWYMLKILPCMASLAVLGTFIAGRLCETFGVVFNWEGCWRSLAFVVAFGVALHALGFGVEFGIGVGGAFSLGLAIAVGLGFSVGGALALGAGMGLASAVWFGAELAENLGVKSAVGIGVVGAVVLAVAFGLLSWTLSNSNFGAGGIAFGLGFLGFFFRLPSYPFQGALSSFAYLLVKSNPAAAKSAWSWCPVSWNEVIWLPMPFAGKVLATLAREDRVAGFRIITFFAIYRRLERRVALTAAAELAVNDLRANTLGELARISERMAWTIDPPADFSPEFNSTLHRVDLLAQRASQYLTLNDAHRKSEALRVALECAEALQNSLVATRGRLVPQLLRVTKQWRKLLEDESRMVASRREALKEICNPFVFGNPVVETADNTFAGRRDIVRKVEAAILNTRQAPTLLLHGARRMGKTSILNQLHRLLGPEFVPIIIDCQNPAIVESEATLLRFLTQKISEGLKRRRIMIKPLDAWNLTREPFAVFDDWLQRTERALPERTRLLLCLDEYERLQQTLDDGWGGKVLDELRHLLQHHSSFVLMFAGAHAFHELGAAWTDRFISAKSVRVSFLSRDEVIPLLTEPVPDFDMTYAAGSLDVLINATYGQPFLTQAVAYELVDFLNERSRREATPADVEEAIARSLVRGVVYFENVWSNALQEGQSIMLAVARSEAPPDGVLAHRWLREHDVLFADGKFAVPMMERWVKEKALQSGT